MHPVSIALASRLLPRVGQAAARMNGFHGWLSAGTYSFSRVGTSEAFAFDRISIEEFVQYANFDYERFALSCLETYLVFQSERSNRNVISWPLLKAYYAAFYSAHSLMRCLGCGLTQIGSERAKSLSSLSDMYGSSLTNFVPGTYFYKIVHDEDTDDARIEVVEFRKGSGVHESFWILFCEFLLEIARQSVAKGLPDAGDFLSSSVELSDAIRLGGDSGVWLSAIRNAVNYQHRYDVWNPVRKQAECSIAFNKIPKLDSINLNFSKKKSPIFSFLCINLCIVRIGLDLGDLIAQRSTMGSAFGQKWRRIKSQLT